MRLNTLFVLFASAAQGLERNDLSARASSVNPLDFSWIKKWAAVGDSFTAGIGSGNTYSSKKDDIACSRYDYSYPAIMNQFFGRSVTDFTYLACSGDASVDIADQIAKLSTGLDLAVMTAGGNDLCLTSIISTCILQSVTSESSCQKAITKAQSAIDDILESNIVALLNSLDKKMADKGVIVLSSYAPYFNNQTSDCADKEDWVLTGQAGTTSLLLSKAHRTSFNNLVAHTNAKLKSAVDKVAKTASSTVVFSDWSAWGEAIGGRFCEPGSSPNPEDKSNDNALFYKLPTYKVFNPGTVYRRDSEWVSDSTLEYSSNITSIQEAEQEQSELDQLMDWISSPLAKRDGPTIGVCGRNSGSGVLPDSLGKIFHPTNLGHESIASYVTWTIGKAIAKREGVTSPACQIVDEITCHSSKGSKGYASAYSLYAHTEEFCKDAVPDLNGRETGTLFSKRYNKNTLDDVVFTVTKDAGAADLDSKTCNTAVNRILDGCDGNNDENPMNWKSGGTYANGPFTYNIAPVRTNRPFPAPKAPSAKCTGVNHYLWHRYNIRGAGWATGWWFEYFDKPDSDGYEWLAKFNSPIATEARCYSNNKVQKWSGGPSDDGCH